MRMIPELRLRQTAPSLTGNMKRILALIPFCAATTPTFEAAAPQPLKVFILDGQSNMDGQANVSRIDFLGEDKDPSRAVSPKKFKPDAKTLITRDNVWIANGGVYDKLQPGFGGRKHYDKLGNNIGPEYAFGYFMGEALEEQVLLIKYGPGGQSLYANFRPPSAGRPEIKGRASVGSHHLYFPLFILALPPLCQ